MFGGQLGNIIQVYKNDQKGFDLTYVAYSLPAMMLGNAFGLVINQWVPGVVQTSGLLLFVFQQVQYLSI